MPRLSAKFKKIILLATVATMGLAASHSYGASLEEIKARGIFRAGIQNERPYSYIDADGNAKGLGPEVALEVLKRIGIDQVDFVVVPFSSLIPGLRANRWDMVAGQQTIKPERCEVVSFSNPMSTSGEALLVKKGNPKNLHSYDDIKASSDVKVALQAGDIELTYFQAYGISPDKTVIVPGNTDAVDALNAGRADAYVKEDVSASMMLASGALPDFEMADPFTQPTVDGKSVLSYGAHTFRKEDEELRQAYNKELGEFMKTPEFAAIVEKNGMPKVSTERALTQTAEERCAVK